ncbi:hypothetical protein HN51_040472 [Arachis hypogaea]
MILPMKNFLTPVSFHWFRWIPFWIMIIYQRELSLLQIGRINQVFISYGKKSNGELLLLYGFVPREGANPCDSVELSVSLKKFDQSYKEKLELLKKYSRNLINPARRN